MMQKITSIRKTMPNLFLALVIFMPALLALRSKNNSMSCILTHFQLINNLLSATFVDPDAKAGILDHTTPVIITF